MFTKGLTFSTCRPPPCLISWHDSVDFPVRRFRHLVSRYERYDEMSNDSAHLVSKLEGITDADLEWSLTGFVDNTDINMGHLGFEWEQTQYDLSFDANRPVGEFHRLSFGSFRPATPNWMSLRRVIEPFRFGINLKFLSWITIKRIRVSTVSMLICRTRLRLAKICCFLLGRNSRKTIWRVSVSARSRLSWMANEVMFSGRLLEGSPSTFPPGTLHDFDLCGIGSLIFPSNGVWVNKAYLGDESLDREEMDAYELGWRLRPNKDLLFELSVYQYDTQNAVRAASASSVNAYQAKDAQAYGGELSVDWRVSESWRLRGGYSQAKGKVEGVRVYDFPENTASLSSHFRYSDQITLVQNLFYAGKTEIPSDYNPIAIPAHLRLDLGVIWEPKEGWEIGLFGRDLLEPYHLETMYPGVDVEPARVERTFLISITKDF